MSKKIALDRAPHAWGYARASTDKQEITVESQQAQITAYYNYKLLPMGVAPLVIFSDPGVSGGIEWMARPQGKLLFEAMLPGDHIIVAVHDRPFRSILDALNTIALLEANDVKLHILNMNLDMSDPMGKAMFHMMMTFAQLERDMVSVRTKRALRWKKERGLPHNPHAPVGWLKIGLKRESRYVPDKKKRILCYTIVELREKHGMAFESIPSELRRRRQLRSETMTTDVPFKRLNPADEYAYSTIQVYYRTAKNGFPLYNGTRKHIFKWEPELWRSWGVPYTGDLDNPSEPTGDDSSAA